MTRSHSHVCAPILCWFYGLNSVWTANLWLACSKLYVLLQILLLLLLLLIIIMIVVIIVRSLLWQWNKTDHLEMNFSVSTFDELICSSYQVRPPGGDRAQWAGCRWKPLQHERSECKKPRGSDWRLVCGCCKHPRNQHHRFLESIDVEDTFTSCRVLHWDSFTHTGVMPSLGMETDQVALLLCLCRNWWWW